MFSLGCGGPSVVAELIEVTHESAKVRIVASDGSLSHVTQVPRLRPNAGSIVTDPSTGASSQHIFNISSGLRPYTRYVITIRGVTRNNGGYIVLCFE